MSTELSEVEAILERVLPDPRGYAERVFRQLVNRVSTELPSEGGEDAVEAVDATATETLVDRNVLLAAALGACDCWGQDLDCPMCSGQGSVGWMEPEPGLYAEYVQPAVLRVTKTKNETTNEGGPG